MYGVDSFPFHSFTIKSQRTSERSGAFDFEDKKSPQSVIGRRKLVVVIAKKPAVVQVWQAIHHIIQIDNPSLQCRLRLWPLAIPLTVSLAT